MSSSTPIVVTSRASYESTFKNLKNKFDNSYEELHNTALEVDSCKRDWYMSNQLFSKFPKTLSALKPNEKTKKISEIQTLFEKFSKAQEATGTLLKSLNAGVRLFAERNAAALEIDAELNLEAPTTEELNDKQNEVELMAAKASILYNNFVNRIPKAKKDGEAVIAWLGEPSSNIISSAANAITSTVFGWFGGSSSAQTKAAPDEEDEDEIQLRGTDTKGDKNQSSSTSPTSPEKPNGTSKNGQKPNGGASTAGSSNGSGSKTKNS